MQIAKKALEYIKIARIELAVLVGVLVLDLVTKAIVEATMSLYQTIEVIPSFFNLCFVLNDKAAFGSLFGLEHILGDLGIKIFFILTTTIAVAVASVLMYRWRNRQLFLRIALALSIAGALGNFYDRMTISAVRDFAQIVFFGLDLPFLGRSFYIFNIADVGVTMGIPLLGYFIIFHLDKPAPTTSSPDSAPAVPPPSSPDSAPPVPPPSSPDSAPASPEVSASQNNLEDENADQI